MRNLLNRIEWWCECVHPDAWWIFTSLRNLEYTDYELGGIGQCEHCGLSYWKILNENIRERYIQEILNVHEERLLRQRNDGDNDEYENYYEEDDEDDRRIDESEYRLEDR